MANLSIKLNFCFFFLQKLIAENEEEIHRLKFDLVQAENLSEKVDNLQFKLVAQGKFRFIFPW